MTVPLVSISCLAYNHAPYIRQCLDGFVMQKTNFPIEVLIHDDASTDGTAELFWGMKQRAAVVLALQPRILLMDEPFASLDNITRRTLQELTCRVCDKYGITVMFVTHSVEEAVRMAAKIVVMNRKGNIEIIFENSFRLKPSCEGQALLVGKITGLMDKFCTQEAA